MNKLRVSYFCGEYAAAIESARRSPETPVKWVFQALSLAELGKMEAARHSLAEMYKRHPTCTPQGIIREPWLGRSAALTKFEEGLQKLGISSVA
jgi:hypothetical protein